MKYFFFTFITQNYFIVQNDIRRNLTHYFLTKILTERELQQIAFNHSWDMGFQDLIILYEKCTAKPYSFLIIDTTLASDKSSPFRTNLLERI